MIRKVTLAAALLLGAVPALASPPPQGPEVRIPRMSNFLEWVADGKNGVYIRAESGKWYYARTQSKCSRLRPATSLSFQTSRGELDRFGALRVEGWRCPLASVVESGPPPAGKRNLR